MQTPKCCIRIVVASVAAIALSGCAKENQIPPYTGPTVNPPEVVTTQAVRHVRVEISQTTPVVATSLTVVNNLNRAVRVYVRQADQAEKHELSLGNVEAGDSATFKDLPSATWLEFEARDTVERDVACRIVEKLKPSRFRWVLQPDTSAAGGSVCRENVGRRIGAHVANR